MQAYDEMFDGQGRVRAHWRGFQQVLSENGQGLMELRQAQVERQIRENGITYNVYADPRGADRPWELDPIPNILPADDWQALAAGIAQRARLLDSVLADVYGPQHLLREGLLPPELVFGHNNFLWPCQGVKPPEGTFLHVYAADVRRAADGHWWVMADRTQAPSGAGYALENRSIISRTFPEQFRQLRVRHLGDYFRTLRETLTRQAPCEQGENPLLVLLTPGRFNEAYFEHLYLARQLAMPLVEGSDLTVRNSTLYMKTLGGLQRVHAVFRRLDDDFCDPLELRSDSALGVPGLLDVVRQQRVLVANALGSGVLESPGLLGFLPAIQRRLFGDDLLLPSIASWWCGEAAAREEALARMDGLKFCAAFPSQSFAAVLVDQLSAGQRQDLIRRIQAKPYAYVAQEVGMLSRAPVWREHQLYSRSIGMRVYAVASAEGYRVMPGGLTRVASATSTEVVAMQSGGGSKDTWVLAGGQAVGEHAQLRPLGSRDIVRHDLNLPSRTVENLFWYGRYTERCEDLTRLLRLVLERYIGDDEPLPLQVGVQMAEHLGLLPEEGDFQERLLQALLGEDWPYSLAANLQRLEVAVGQIRGRLSRANWQALVQLQQEAAYLEREGIGLGELLDGLGRLLMALSALSGYALDDMTRDEGWRFLTIGRRIERLQFISEAIAGFVLGSGAQDRTGLECLLELGNSTITYLSRYQAEPQLIPVLDLLLLDEQNPHSIAFQLGKLKGALAHVQGDFARDAERRLAALAGWLQAVDLASFESSLFGLGGQVAALQGLSERLMEIVGSAGELSDALALHFFAHVDASRQTMSH